MASNRDIAATHRTAVAMRGVNFSYGDNRILNDFSIDIHAGELLTVLGPSGSGKSTVLNLLVGVISSDSGKIIMAGRDITNMPIAKRNMGYVFQNYALFPHMSVWENIAFPLKVRGVAHSQIMERVAEVLDTVRLAGFERRSVAALSGGQQQRVALARAVIFRPDLVLLDEPLAALDRKLRQEMQYELRAFQQQLGLTSIMVTHDQEEALSISDRIVVLRDGNIVQIGTPADVYHRPVSRFVAEFIGNANVVTCSTPRNAAAIVALGELATQRNGHDGSFMIRPERARLTSSDGILSGTVTDVSLTGPSMRYSVQLTTGESFVVLSSNTTSNHGVGETVQISWDAADMWPLPDDD